MLLYFRSLKHCEDLLAAESFGGVALVVMSSPLVHRGHDVITTSISSTFHLVLKPRLYRIR